MGFVDAIILTFRRTFDFGSRSGRAEFWWFQLSILLVEVIFFPLGLYVAFDFMWIAFGYSALAFLPNIALHVRRLQDIGISGFCVVPCIIAIVIFPSATIGFVALASIIFGLIPGMTGSNKYGPPFVWNGPEKPEKLSISEDRFYAIDAAATAALVRQEKIIEFRNAYEAADDQACWQLLLDVGIDKADVYAFIHGMTDDGFIPHAIIDASNTAAAHKG